MIKRGCIISPASVIPAHICELFELIKAREAISISRLSSRIYTLITGLFEETMDSECSRTRILAKKDKINDKNFAIYLVLNLFYFGFIVSFQ